ncbi:MAG: DUF2892 domain-containing protein [Chloroflexi bacterium]|nr:DUF2892 domain-containing protein [Chloroflexota bacterium]
MKQNMSSLDRIIRLAVAVVIGILYFTGTLTGWVAIVLGIVAVILALTSILGFCPLYGLLGISTKKS